MLTKALTCSSQPYYASNPYSLALQKVVVVSATEEGHWHSENFMGCTVHQLHCVIELIQCIVAYTN